MNTSQRIQKISKFFLIKKYLEIGVNTGETFKSLNFELKVGVDPAFQFDFKSIADKNTVFHQETSDKYFTNQSNKDKFDLIFLDGFHESKQTFRDFINSINYSHDKTIIIIDDVYPNDIFSSLMNNPIGFRQLNNPLNNDNSWHGDVFKTIFLIHDLCPQYSYCTIDWPDGNPQTICYKSPRKNFRPFFTSLEAIDRTTYLDLIGNLSLLNLTSEHAAIEEVRSFIEN